MIGQKKFDAAILLLDSLTIMQPRNGQILLALGNAHQGQNHVDLAAAAFEKALSVMPNPVPAWLALFGLYAGAGRADDALPWFQRLENGVDLTAVALVPAAPKLRGDARFAVLFPEASNFEPPFVESEARIIHEWRGEAAGDEFGWIARGLGDVDGDGVTDVVISATGNPPYGSTNGAVYAYSGKSGRALWKHAGEKGWLLGFGLESAGDVDGDGTPDAVAGAPGANMALVLSGRDGHELLRLTGDSADVNLGMAVAGIGDVNGDGRADFVAGAPGSNAKGAGAGRVYLFSGRDGHRFEALDGEKPGDGFGSTVGGGQGLVIVGAVGAGPKAAGRVYLYRGLEPAPAFTKDPEPSGIALGFMFVSVLGDVDGDGAPDIYASDFSDTTGGRATGRVYLYSGKTGQTIRTLIGDRAGAGFGIGAARSGDIDGDGRADLVVGAWQDSRAAWSGGRVQVFSGRDGRVLQTMTGRVPGETLGFDAVGVGDVDGDGASDFLVTSAWSMVNGIRSGRAFIVAGTTKRPH